MTDTVCYEYCCLLYLYCYMNIHAFTYTVHILYIYVYTYTVIQYLAVPAALAMVCGLAEAELPLD